MKNTKLAPPINRMGGKSRLRNLIIDMIPQHTCYCEVFFGAGWVYFGKEPSKVEVINDIDQELVNLFRMLKFHTEEVERLLQYELYSRDYFDIYKNLNPEALTEIQRAIRFLYLIGCSFASKGNHFGYGATRKPSQKIFSDDFKVIRDRLKNTYIENLDFRILIEKYDRPNTFFFCDPPYHKTAGYKNKFMWDDHVNLKGILSGIKGKFLLTINDHPDIRELYKDFSITETQVRYTTSNIKNDIKANELIIKNY